MIVCITFSCAFLSSSRVCVSANPQSATCVRVVHDFVYQPSSPGEPARERVAPTSRFTDTDGSAAAQQFSPTECHQQKQQWHQRIPSSSCRLIPDSMPVPDGCPRRSRRLRPASHRPVANSCPPSCCCCSCTSCSCSLCSRGRKACLHRQPLLLLPDSRTASSAPSVHDPRTSIPA